MRQAAIRHPYLHFHVEMRAVALMIERGHTTAQIVLNNVPCGAETNQSPGCHQCLELVLSVGSMLTVWEPIVTAERSATHTGARPMPAVTVYCPEGDPLTTDEPAQLRQTLLAAVELDEPMWPLMEPHTADGIVLSVALRRDRGALCWVGQHGENDVTGGGTNPEPATYYLGGHHELRGQPAYSP